MIATFQQKIGKLLLNTLSNNKLLWYFCIFFKKNIVISDKKCNFVTKLVKYRFY